MNSHDVIAALDPKHGIFLDCHGRGADSTFEVHDPATTAVIADVSDGSAAEATDAERLAALIGVENGKPQADAHAEIGYAAEFFRLWGGATGTN